MGGDDHYLTEPGEGGPSVLMEDLAALRWAAQQEAVNVGRMPLEPELWQGGRMEFEFERTLAHEHESLRDRLANFVGAAARDVIADLYEIAGTVALARDHLATTDRELAVALDSWNRTYREVHEDELELGRYFRLKSKTYQLMKYLIAGLLVGAELAVSTVLFDRIMTQDIAIFPLLFALGLIMVLVVVPHYAAIALKDGVTKYHEAELDAYQRAGVDPPAKLLKKARLEEVEDKGVRVAAVMLGILLVALIVPVSLLRARELGGEHDRWLWFSFFLLLQAGVSGYFFLREWLDYGTAAVNLKHHDEAKFDAERARAGAVAEYAAHVGEFNSAAQNLYFLYREAPRWDSHVVATYLSTVHYFRHLVTLQHPDLDVFIAHATVPSLGSLHEHADRPGSRDMDPIRSEHPALERNDAYGREWWLKQLEGALVENALDRRTDPFPVEPVMTGAADADPSWILVSKGPADLLEEFLRRFFGIAGGYQRPEVFDFIEEVDDDIEVRRSEPPSPPAPEHPAAVEFLENGRRGTDVPVGRRG